MRWVVALFGVVILAFLGIYGLQFTLAEAGEHVTVTNESWDPVNGTWVEVDDANEPRAIFENQTTVYNESDIEMTRGTDYRWEASNASLFTFQSGDLDKEDNATVSYEYDQPTAEQQSLTEMLALMPEAVGVAIPVFGFLIFLGFLLRG